MARHTGGSAERPAVFFDHPDDFRDWLAEHHDTRTELWMGLRKRHVSPRGIVWAEAVEEALCYGWIDSVMQTIDADSTRQRFTPRKAASNWSKVNVALVAKLVDEGRMRPPGLAAFERRRPDRSGVYSYEQVVPHRLPEAYDARLRADTAAASFFYDRATESYRRLAVAWVVTAKQEATREKRLGQLIADCAAGQLIPPQRYGTPPRWATLEPPTA